MASTRAMFYRQRLTSERQTSLTNGSFHQPAPVVFEQDPFVIDDNERRQLRAVRHQAMPVRMSRRWWLRWPMYFIHRMTTDWAIGRPFLAIVLATPAVMSARLQWNPEVVFGLNFVALLALAFILDFATEEVLMGFDTKVYTLINHCFGPALQIIIGVIAIKLGQIQVLQSLLVGTLIMNLLLVFGISLCVAGRNGGEQSFNYTATRTVSNLVVISSVLFSVPIGYQQAMGIQDNIPMALSHAIATMILILYFLYLYFRVISHSNIFEEEERDYEETTAFQNQDDPGNLQLPSPIAPALCLVLVLLLIVLCAFNILTSVAGFAEFVGLSHKFVGLFLLPILGHPSDIFFAVKLADQGLVDSAISLGMGNSLQIAFFVTPILMVIGWIVGTPVAVTFGTLEVIVLVLAIVLVNNLITSGKSNYLEGSMCIGLYIIVALAFYVYPDDANGIRTKSALEDVFRE